MKRTNKATVLTLLIAGLLLINLISGLVPGRLDLTDGRVYTLSDASRKLLATLEEPVVLEFYFSRGVSDLPISWKNYAGRVESLLEGYEAAAKGVIELRVIDPLPDTDAEAEAVRQGLDRLQLANGEGFFLGLGARQGDRQEVIAFLTPEREHLLEYDLSRLIATVQQTENPKLGLISRLPLLATPGNPALGREGRPGWLFFDELSQRYDLVRVGREGLPEDLDLLIIIHPPTLPAAMQFEIDQFLLSGKPLWIALDPSSFMERQRLGQAGGFQQTGSSLDPLLRGWGIQFDPGQMLGDLELARKVPSGVAGQRVPMPVWLDVSGDFIRQGSPVAAQLDQLLFLESGTVELMPDSSLDFQPLVVSSGQNSLLMPGILSVAGPEQIADQIQTGAMPRTLAAVISGKFPSAFPEGKPPENEDDEWFAELFERENPGLRESTDRSALIFFADTDFLSDAASTVPVDRFGAQAYQPMNDNFALAGNSVEFLTGDQSLISLRGKGGGPRNFTRIRAMEREASARFEAQIQTREARLREIQSQLEQLQQEAEESGQIVATPEVEQAIDDFQTQEAELRQELRLIRKQLRESIRAKETQLALLNLVPVPLLIAVFGAVYFLVRSKRKGR